MQNRLLKWYRYSKRDLPWRRNPTLYKTILSEFMLQQTRVDQVIPYFNRFVEKFPTIKHFAEAPFEQVIKLWEGLGYYRRAKNLHETIKKLAAHKKITLELVRDCPGVGDYTLAAVGSIAWGEPLAVVDGNVKRVIARFLAIEEEIEKREVDLRIRKVADEWLHRRASGDWNQAMMELGATVCLPRSPLCSVCPLHFGCKAFKLGRAEEFPKRLPKNPRPHKYMASAVIVRNGKCHSEARRAEESNEMLRYAQHDINHTSEFLICKRPNRGLLSNLWEFPNVEVGRVKDASGQLKKLLRKQNLNINVVKKIAVVNHAYSHFSVTMQAYLCRWIDGASRGADGQKWKWSRVNLLSQYPFPKVHKPVVDFLQNSQNIPKSTIS